MRRLSPGWIFICICCALAFNGCDRFTPAEEKIARAEKRLAEGDQRGALIELQNVVRSDSDNVRARMLLAEVSLQLGDPASARKELDQAIAAGAAPAETTELLARIMLAQGQSTELLSGIRSGEIELSAPASALYRGLALLAGGDRDAALEALLEALRLDPMLSRAHMALAETRMSSGDFDAALDEITAALKIDPADAEAWLLRGTIQGRRGEFRDALAAFQSARKNAPNRLSAAQYNTVLAGLTESQLATGDKAGARKTHEELATRAPDAPATQLLAARLAMADQEYSDAIAAARKAVNIAPQFVPARMLLGAALLAQGRLNQAEVELSAVVRAVPESIEARKLLAQVNLRLQRPDIAMQVLAPVQQADVGDAQLNALMGWANLQRGDAGAGISLLEKGSASDPGNDKLKMDLATAYIGAGRSEDAVKLLQSLPAKAGDARRTALLVNAVASARGVGAALAELEKLRAAEPDSISVLNLGAAYHAQRGDLERASEWIGHAATVDPKDIATLINRARIEVAAGDPSAAKQTLQRAASLDPSNMAASLALAELALREGDAAGAAGQLEQRRAADPKAVEPRLALARLYLGQQKVREADALVREIQSVGADAVTSQALGRMYLDAGRFDEALNFLRDAATQDPNNPAYAMDVARAQLALGNTAGARETLRNSAESSPESIAAAATLVLLDLREGKRDAAMSRLGTLKESHPRDPAVWVLEGEVAVTGQDYEAAATAYEQAYRLSPSAATALRVYRARTQANSPQPQALLEDWLRKHPNDEPVRMGLAEAYLQAGKQAQAIAQYEVLANEIKPNPMALNNLAWFYHQAGDRRAVGVAQRAYNAEPSIAAIADTYGWILLSEGRVQEALPILERAATTTGAAPDIRYHHAVALTKAGRESQARAILESLVAEFRNSPIASEAGKLLAELDR